MQTLKTAVVVVLLLALLYGVYVVLSKPEAQEAASDLARELVPPRIEQGGRAADPRDMDPAADAWPAGFGPSGSGPAGFSDPLDQGTAERRLRGQDPSDLQPPQAWAPPPASLTARSPQDDSQHPTGSHSRPGASQPLDHRGPDGRASVDRFSDDRNLDRRGSVGRDAEPHGGSPYSSRDVMPVTAETTVAGPEGSPGEAPNESANNAAGNIAANLGTQGFSKAMRTAKTHLADGQYREALYTLSIFYGSPDLTAEEHRQLAELLDPLAGKVVYSTEHLLTAAYEVRRNETLFEIAERYQVPWQLLQNINGVRDPQVLVAGTPLKVVPGPFRAEIDLRRGELTLFLGRLYAGRFPVTFGSDPPPEPGDYEIRDKRSDRNYYGGDGRTIAADDPRNPYGGIWLDLGQELCIHGSPESRGPEVERLGCVSLSPRDARDVYGILSLGSKVVIRQ